MMKFIKLLLSTILIFFLFNCNLKSKDELSSDIYGDFFESQEASDLNKKGIELSKQGKYDEGKAAFLKSLEIEPNNPTIISNLGLINYYNYDYDNAIKFYKKSYEISDSTYHTAAVNLALTYYYVKEFSKGIEITNYVIEHENDKVVLPIAYIHRALNYIGNGDCFKAKDDLHYIIGNFQEFKNIDYHIKDLTKKTKNCVQNRR